jgi:regulatory protein
MNRKKSISKQEALSRAMRYCAYQERCEQDVKKKLREWGLTEVDQQNAILGELKEENFIDQERFAGMFVKGKLFQNQWGQRKIRYTLREKNVDESIIEKALQEIPMEKYKEILDKLLLKKCEELKDEPSAKKIRIKRFLLQRGFTNQEIEESFKTNKI